MIKGKAIHDVVLLSCRGGLQGGRRGFQGAKESRRNWRGTWAIRRMMCGRIRVFLETLLEKMPRLC